MWTALILLAALFLLGFISTAHSRVRAWCCWRSTKSTTKKVNAVEEPQISQLLGRKREELKKVFETFDKDGDGFVTREELKEAMKGAGVVMDECEVEEMVEKMDGNGDGLVDFSEFSASFELGVGKGEEEEEEVLREAFEVFDGNKDGVISVEELGMVLRALGLKQGMKVRDCEEMIRRVDVDGDGRIDFGEFKNMMRAGGGSLFGSSSCGTS